MNPWDGSLRMAEYPADSRMPRSRWAFAVAKGPRALRSIAGCGGKKALAIWKDSDAHSFSATARQQMKARRADPRPAWRILAKAAMGSTKNITPKREKIRSNSAWKE